MRLPSNNALLFITAGCIAIGGIEVGLLAARERNPITRAEEVIPSEESLDSNEPDIVPTLPSYRPVTIQPKIKSTSARPRPVVPKKSKAVTPTVRPSKRPKPTITIAPSVKPSVIPTPTPTVPTTIEPPPTTNPPATLPTPTATATETTPAPLETS